MNILRSSGPETWNAYPELEFLKKQSILSDYSGILEKVGFIDLF
jgi:hypothetical protein